MNRNKETDRKRSGKGKRYYNKSKDKRNRENKEYDKDEALIKGDRDNDPNYYFTDKMLADQVTQMSFQNLAGMPISIGANDFEVPNIVTIALNPCPGVTKSADYGTPSLQKMSGINLAGFKLFSMLSAYTGRIAAYGPQDISILILALGELLSVSECIRRMFGVAFTMNMRNRAYPREILTQGMRVDADDLFTNYSDYRTRFNALITLVNQLPIPKNIEYLRKCMEMYQRIYLDYQSAMAQTLIPMPATTWVLDETTNPAGSKLVTTPFCTNAAMGSITPTPYTMKDYLDVLDTQVSTLLNSSTLQVVYTDLLNLATKMKVDFVKLDYLGENYMVTPEPNTNFSLQMHNATICGFPETQTTSITGTYNVTAYNDVEPDANTNTVFYNPAFVTLSSLATGGPRTGNYVLVDMFTDSPTVEDRVEVTRYTSISGQNEYATKKLCDAVLPDHYVCAIAMWTNVAGSPMMHQFQATVLPGDNGSGVDVFKDVACLASNIDWFPRFYEVAYGTKNFTGHAVGDLNFYTVLDQNWLWKVNQFIALGLYIMR